MQGSSNKDIKPRFKWPLRVFLAYFLFDMFFRSLVCLTPAEDDWPDELSMEKNPKSLPTRRELIEIENGVHPAGYSNSFARWADSLSSFGRFFVPYPTKSERNEIGSFIDVGKYSLTWMHTRLTFISRFAGVDQEFPMFSPNVGTSDTVGRLLLIYEDGSTDVHRLIADPVDLTRYSHWFDKKQKQVEGAVHNDPDCRLGVCMMVANKFAENESGSPLVKIQVFKVHYDYPNPKENAKEFLTEMSGPPEDRIDSPFWEYEVHSQRGRFLE